MNDLAITLRDQGKLDEAVTIMEKVLESRKWILGEEHPDTLSTMSNLANAFGGQGEFLTMRT